MDSLQPMDKIPTKTDLIRAGERERVAERARKVAEECIKVRELKAEGRTLSEISAELGFSQATIYARLKGPPPPRKPIMGLKRRTPAEAEAEIAQVARLLSQGKTAPEIAKVLNMNVGTVYNRIRTYRERGGGGIPADVDIGLNTDETLRSFAQYLIKRSPDGGDSGIMKPAAVIGFMAILGLGSKIERREVLRYSKSYNTHTKVISYGLDHDGIRINAGSNWGILNEKPHFYLSIEINLPGIQFKSDNYPFLGYIRATHGVMETLVGFMKPMAPADIASSEEIEEGDQSGWDAEPKTDSCVGLPILRNAMEWSL